MFKFQKLPSQEFLKECFSYDYSTGELSWKNRPEHHFSSKYRSAAGCMNNWNSKMAGKPALGSISKEGYKFGRLDGKTVKAHRIIWKMIHGTDPDGQIDHINGIRDDNRAENLRSVDERDNRANAELYKTNKSGCHGVRWNKATNNWRVTISRDKKRYHIGMFKNIDDAIAARKKAEASLGFHANHGRPKN